MSNILDRMINYQTSIIPHIGVGSEWCTGYGRGNSTMMEDDYGSGRGGYSLAGRGYSFACGRGEGRDDGNY
jgi:hypothetical protein